jgi:hypothetical protein
VIRSRIQSTHGRSATKRLKRNCLSWRQQGCR